VNPYAICNALRRNLGRTANPTSAMKTPMESYVVRIYRCQGGPMRQLVGVVETPRLSSPKAFTSVAQLWDILSARTPARRAKAPTRPADAQHD
jgi:hypothetical protein